MTLTATFTCDICSDPITNYPPVVEVIKSPLWEQPKMMPNGILMSGGMILCDDCRKPIQTAIGRRWRLMNQRGDRHHGHQG